VLTDQLRLVATCLFLPFDMFSDFTVLTVL
jgi:hypothetical protein